MAGPLTALRVRPTPASALPGDAPVVIEPDAAGPNRDADAGARQATTRGVVLGSARRSAGIAVLEVVVDGWRFELEVEPATRAALRERAARTQAGARGAGPQEVRAMIPGRIVSVSVERGDPVLAGQPLFVLEAMKMQNEVRAPRDGSVASIAAEPGQTVELGDVLLVLR